MPAMLARRLVPVMAGHGTLLAPRTSMRGAIAARRLDGAGRGPYPGSPRNGRSGRCTWPVGSLAGAAQRKRDTARGIRASMDCPTTTEPGVGCPAPSLLKTDTRGTRSSGRNDACAIGGPARASVAGRVRHGALGVSRIAPARVDRRKTALPIALYLATIATAPSPARRRRACGAGRRDASRAGQHRRRSRSRRRGSRASRAAARGRPTSPRGRCWTSATPADEPNQIIDPPKPTA